MYAHQRFDARHDIALDQRQVDLVGRRIAIGVEAESAVWGLHRPLGYSGNQRLGATAIVNQIGDRADFEAVLLRELQQIGQARHLAVVFEDFADDGRRRHASELREIASGFGVAGAHQHAAALSSQRENVARLHDIFGFRIALDRCVHRARTIRGGDAGSHSVSRFDRYGEVGAHLRAVVEHHRRQIQLSAALFGEREADQAAAILRHEVDRGRRRELRGHHQIALVLAVFLIDQDHHAPGLDLRDDLRDAADRHDISSRHTCRE